MIERIALVTGGIGGRGTAICKQLTDQGCRVIAADLNASPRRRADYRNAMGDHPATIRELDVTDADACEKTIARVVQEHGGLDMLINAAGITRDSTLRKMAADQWQSVLRVNLDGAFNLCRHAVAGMLDRGFGRIVNISSVNGQTGQFGQTNYAAAKAGVHGFTMALARETARKGVTVNSVAPGYIGTEMTQATRPDIRDRIVADITVGRMGQQSDIARAVGFLCDEGAGYITGALIPVNGGMFMSF